MSRSGRGIRPVSSGSSGCSTGASGILPLVARMTACARKMWAWLASLSGTIMARRTGLRKRLAALATGSGFPPICVPQPSAPASKTIIAVKVPATGPWGHPAPQGLAAPDRPICAAGESPVMTERTHAVWRRRCAPAGNPAIRGAPARTGSGASRARHLRPRAATACTAPCLPQRHPGGVPPGRGQKVRPCPEVVVLRASGAMAAASEAASQPAAGAQPARRGQVRRASGRARSGRADA